MEAIGYIFLIILSGLLVGALARLLVPGPDPMGLGLTALIGVVGGLTAALIARALWGNEAAPGLLMSVLVTAVLVWILRGTRRRSVYRA